LLVCEIPGYSDNITCNTMTDEVLFCGEMTLTPFSCRGIRAEDDHCDSGSSNNDKRNNKRNPPGYIVRETLSLHQRIKDGRHEEICDSPTSVAQATSQGIGGAYDVLVEKPR